MNDVEIVKPVAGGRQISIVPMLFDKWRLYIGPEASMFYDDGW